MDRPYVSDALYRELEAELREECRQAQQDFKAKNRQRYLESLTSPQESEMKPNATPGARWNLATRDLKGNFKSMGDFTSEARALIWVELRMIGYRLFDNRTGNSWDVTRIKDTLYLKQVGGQSYTMDVPGLLPPKIAIGVPANRGWAGNDRARTTPEASTPAGSRILETLDARYRAEQARAALLAPDPARAVAVAS